eukprot:scaffold79280_cov58-Phaeocystis_antarctica.AAC.1
MIAISMHSPCWQKPWAVPPPQLAVGGSNRHWASQHVPLHSAPAANLQPSQHCPRRGPNV